MPAPGRAATASIINSARARVMPRTAHKRDMQLARTAGACLSLAPTDDAYTAIEDREERVGIDLRQEHCGTEIVWLWAREVEDEKYKRADG